MFYKYLVHHEDQSTNEIETKSQTRKQIEKINEIESWFFELVTLALQIWYICQQKECILFG
jgi:hypothetical protein